MRTGKHRQCCLARLSTARASRLRARAHPTCNWPRKGRCPGAKQCVHTKLWPKHELAALTPWATASGSRCLPHSPRAGKPSKPAQPATRHLTALHRALCRTHGLSALEQRRSTEEIPIPISSIDRGEHPRTASACVSLKLGFVLVGSRAWASCMLQPAGCWRAPATITSTTKVTFRVTAHHTKRPPAPQVVGA